MLPPTTTILLKDKETTATFIPVTSPDEIPSDLLEHICDEFNSEIQSGNTNPIIHPLHIQVFRNYWFGNFAAILLLGAVSTPLQQHATPNSQWQRECLGTFCIKPNYPGRSAHICTGELLVNSALRNKGIGRTLAEKFLEWAPKLGYTQVMFNLVYETNIAARRILENLQFKRLFRIRNAGILKGHQTAVDAIIYGHSLVEVSPERVNDVRFDKIRYYLETGQYPLNSDRHEKSRLRSSAAHYRLENGKLLLKDRQVISDPEEQLQIALKVHQENDHFGVNRTTTVIAEKYHWPRIKESVATAIKSCEYCRKPQAKRPRIEEVEDTVMPNELELGFYDAFEQNGDGEELAIARALIQANEFDEEL